MRNSARVQAIRLFVVVEAACFAIAASIHGGALLPGYEHSKACIAESALAAVLFAGFALIWMRPAWTRTIALLVQGFALLGTLIGVFTIMVGVGPRTVPDLIYHVVILSVLIWGVVVAVRSR